MAAVEEPCLQPTRLKACFNNRFVIARRVDEAPVFCFFSNINSFSAPRAPSGMNQPQKQTATMLLNLPVEILSLILHEHLSKCDLRRLAEAVGSGPFCAVVQSLLYKEIVILIHPRAGPGGKTGYEYNIVPSIPSGSGAAHLLQYTRAFKVRMGQKPIAMGWGCLPKRYSRLGDDICKLLRKLKDESLVSFSWETNECIYPAIIRHLRKKQSSIQRLSLKTSPYCRQHIDDQVSPDFSAFRSLAEISWTFVRVPEDIPNTKAVLQTVAEHLRKLELTFLDVNPPRLKRRTCGIRRSGRTFPFLEVASTDGQEELLSFPSLKELSLSRASFEGYDHLIATFVDFSQLTSFSSYNCAGISDLLRAVTFSGVAVRLKSLVIMSDAGLGPCDDVCGGLLEFLRSFKGLQRLHLRFSPKYFEDITGALAGHIKTLQEFGYNSMCYPVLCETNKELLSTHTGQDSLKMIHARFTEVDLCKAYRQFSTGWVTDLDLLEHEESGQSLSPSGHDNTSDEESETGKSQHTLDQALASANEWGSKLVHEFANWVFGPDGIISLHLLVVGKSPHQTRLTCRALVICRAEKPVIAADGSARYYRLLSIDDRDAWNMLHENSEFFAAVPADTELEMT